MFVVSHPIQRKLRSRFSPPGLFVLVCIGVSAAVGLDTNQTVAYRIFAFLFCLMTVSLAFTLRFRTDISVRRDLPRYATVGEPLTYRITVENNGSRPLADLLLTEIPSPGLPSLEEFIHTREPGWETRNRFDRAIGYPRWLHLIRQNQRFTVKTVPLPVLPAYGRGELQMTLTPFRRGVMRLPGIAISRPDPFGLVKALVRLPCPQSVTVLPGRYPLPPVPMPGARRYQSGGVAMASSVGDAEEFVSLREYRPGDPLRRIHWKSWAKVGQPVVKEYQDEFFVRHALILDTFRESGNPDSFEAAVSLAASFVLAVQTRDSLLDLMFVGLEAYCFTAGRGVGHAEKMLEILASVTACPDSSFSELTPVVVDRAPLMAGIVLILLDWDPDRRAFVQRLRAMGLSVMVIVVTSRFDENVFDPGPLADTPDRFKVVATERMETDLTKAFS